ncbi:MAG: hypothetical protein ACE5JI_08020 [Acidobacteriota bacterium]
MRRLSLGLVFLALAGVASAQDNCIDCHLELEDEILSGPARAMRDDVHAQAGLSCASCHGGDPEAEIVDDDYEPAMDPQKGFMTPAPLEIPLFCGRCHADAGYMHRYDPNLAVDQVAQYWTSVHGQRLREGALDVAHCSSCHGSHGIRSAEDPRSPVYPTRVAATCGGCHSDPEHMREYGIPTDQFAGYRNSVHGRALFDQGDLGAPTCNSCHGNHGAAPPGVSSVSLVCGHCHAIQKELFAASLHKQVFDDMGEPECETCHGNHEVAAPTDDLLGVGEGSICLDCHDEGEEAYTVAKALRQEIDGLKEVMAAARQVVGRASRAGMEVSEAEVLLIDANQALVQSRNLVHAFSVEEIAEQVEEGRSLSAQAEEMGRAALAELDYRRKGLAASVFFIVLIVVGLYLKIRQLEGRSETDKA